MIVQGLLPKPDFVVIADTGREKATTWKYLDEVVRPALLAVGIEVHRIGQEWATCGIWSTNGENMLMPAFTTSNGGIGKLEGFCSNEWKVRPCERFLRSLGIPTKEQRRWIGFSTDEARRAMRMMGGKDWQAGRIRFPLINDRPMRRQQSIDFVRSLGWPDPPRSMCYNCPNQSDDEWADITPEELRLAAELEREIQMKDPTIWLHPSCRPIDTIDFAKSVPVSGQTELFDERTHCSSGVCFL
jgi:hypothetical protein